MYEDVSQTWCVPWPVLYGRRSVPLCHEVELSTDDAITSWKTVLKNLRKVDCVLHKDWYLLRGFGVIQMTGKGSVLLESTFITRRHGCGYMVLHTSFFVIWPEYLAQTCQLFIVIFPMWEYFGCWSSLSYWSTNILDIGNHWKRIEFVSLHF